jgi:signal peptidase I
LSNKTAYWFHQPQRGQIIVFRPPAEAGSREDFVKRVIGLPGETLGIRNGVVLINNKPLHESYISPDRAPIAEFGPVIIPEGNLFVMGDNRNNSTDSRVIGFIKREDILGKTSLVLFPFKRFGFVK